MNGMPLAADAGAPLSGGRDRPPRHRLAEAIDLAVVALLLLAYLVAAPGGFRWENDWLRVSMANPSRAVLLALGLLLVRRWRAPGAPTHPWIRRPAAWLRSRFEPAAPLLPRPSPPWTLLEGIGVVALFLVLTGVVLHRQVLAPHGVPDLGDPLFSIWRLAWVAHQFPADPLHLFDGNMFYPELRTLAYSDAMLATALLAAPFLWLGCPQVVVYNAVLLLSFAASGVAMYALVRRLTGDRWASVVAGIAFGFYSFRFEHYSHLELQITFWMPLALLTLHRTIESGRRRDAAVTGLLVALQTLSSLYYGLFLLVMMAVVWAVVTFGGRIGPGVGARGPAVDWRALIRLWLPAVVVLALLLLPVVIPYFQNRAQLGERPPWEARLYSAMPGSYLVAPTLNLVYGGWLDAARRPEVSLFPGLAIVALAIAGAWAKSDARRTAYVVAAFIVFDGSLGANGIVFPTLRDCVLPFRGLRAPARFSILFGLSLSVLAGYGVLRLRQSPRLRGAMASLVPAVCAAVLLVENLPNLRLVPVPPAPPPVYDYFMGAPPSVVADLPFPRSLVDATRDARFLYFSTFHWQRLLTGSSGYFPETFREAVRTLRRFPTDHGLAFLQRRGVAFIVIDRAMCEAGEYERVTTFLDADPRVELVKRITARGQEGSIYRSLHHSTR
jgi:hypothetical protein